MHYGMLSCMVSVVLFTQKKHDVPEYLSSLQQDKRKGGPFGREAEPCWVNDEVAAMVHPTTELMNRLRSAVGKATSQNMLVK